MRCVAAVVLVAYLFQVVAANPSPTPPVPEQPPDPPRDPRIGTYWNSGAGLALVSAAGSNKPGLGLEARFGYRFTGSFGVSGLLDVSFTEPERTKEVFNKGVDLGGETTDAIHSITDWVRGCSKETKALCGFAAIFAYFFVGFLGYGGAGLAILGSPFASTSHIGATVAGTYFIGDREHGGFGEAGVSAMTLFLRDYDSSASALGFMVGIGARLGPVTLAARVILAPAGLQRDARDPRNVGISLFTISYGR